MKSAQGKVTMKDTYSSTTQADTTAPSSAQTEELSDNLETLLSFKISVLRKQTTKQPFISCKGAGRYKSLHDTYTGCVIASADYTTRLEGRFERESLRYCTAAVQLRLIENGNTFISFPSDFKVLI